MTLHLHIGAHKTATTHLQATFIRHRALLAEAGVQFERPDELRALIGSGRRAAAKMGALPSLRRARAMRRLARLDSGAGRLLISDENSLGRCAEIFETKRLYPTAGRQLKIWRRLAGARGAHIYLCVRDYGPFFSGAYVQSIRAAAIHNPDEGDLAALAGLARRWTDVVKDLREALPGARIIAWAFEDYDRLRPRLLEMMTGQVLDPVRRRPMETPSHAAVDAYREERPATAKRLERLALDYPISADNPKFTLWSPTQQAALSDAYQDDLAALSRDLGEDFLRP